MAINAFKRPGKRLRVSGSRFNGTEVSVSGENRHRFFCFLTWPDSWEGANKQLSTNNRLKTPSKPTLVNQCVFISATNKSKGERFPVGTDVTQRQQLHYQGPPQRGKLAAEHTAQPAIPSQASSRHLSWSLAFSAALTAFLSIRWERPGRFSSSRSFTETGTVGLGWSEKQDKPVLMVACALSESPAAKFRW